MKEMQQKGKRKKNIQDRYKLPLKPSHTNENAQNSP
jgi:hypothetical protein